MLHSVIIRRSLLAGVALLGCAPAHAGGVADGAAAAATDEIVVTGTRPANQASAGTKTDTPLIETPQSVSVISSEDIADLGLANLNQALRYVAGVTPEQRGCRRRGL